MDFAKLKEFLLKLRIFLLNEGFFCQTQSTFFTELKEFFAKLNFSAHLGTRGGRKTLKKQAWTLCRYFMQSRQSSSTILFFRISFGSKLSSHVVFYLTNRFSKHFLKCTRNYGPTGLRCSHPALRGHYIVDIIYRS